MREWWNRKRERTRKHNKKDERYSFGDFLADVVFWLPELIIIPFRILFWLLRGIWRLFDFT